MIRTVAMPAALLATGCVTAQPVAHVRFAGAPFVRPPPLHCPDADCPGEVQTRPGAVVAPTTGRTCFLDNPCDLKSGERVTVILALYGGGSYGDWQRNFDKGHTEGLEPHEMERLIGMMERARGGNLRTRAT